MLKIAVYINQLETLNLYQDTTVMLIREGLRRNHDIYIFHEHDLSIKTGNLYSKVKKVELTTDSIKENEARDVLLQEFDLLFIRKDPPVDINFLTTMSFLTMLESKVLMMNSPKGIMQFSEKIWPFMCDIPNINTLITSDISELVKFKKRHSNIVLKPLYNYCGQGIYVSLGNDKNFPSISQLYVDNPEKLPVIAQEYISEVNLGDRRIILLGGEPIGALNRMANQTDFRCNMKMGGEYTLHMLSKTEKDLCEKIRPTLMKNGLHFVGIDIIGNYITEINTTAPTGLIQIKELGGLDLSLIFWNYLENFAKH